MISPINLFRYQTYYLSLCTKKVSFFFSKNSHRKWFLDIQGCFAHKHGLEIGGPTKLFSSSVLPIYSIAQQVDGCNFSSSTVWEGDIQSSKFEYLPGKVGEQYILDGTKLSSIPDNQYDFLLSSHNLEHIANPLKAVAEWKRVLKPGGILFMILPDKRYTFDRKRPVTKFEHIVDDYKSETLETDLTHLPEIISLHDLSLDPDAGRNRNAFIKRCQENFENRCMHHHVFDQALLGKIFGYFELKIITNRFIQPYHQLIIGEKR